MEEDRRERRRKRVRASRRALRLVVVIVDASSIDDEILLRVIVGSRIAYIQLTRRRILRTSTKGGSVDGHRGFATAERCLGPRFDPGTVVRAVAGIVSISSINGSLRDDRERR